MGVSGPWILIRNKERKGKETEHSEKFHHQNEYCTTGSQESLNFGNCQVLLSHNISQRSGNEQF